MKDRIFELRRKRIKSFNEKKDSTLWAIFWGRHKRNVRQRRACKFVKGVQVTRILILCVQIELNFSQQAQYNCTEDSWGSFFVDMTHLVWGLCTGALIKSSKASLVSSVGTATSWCKSSPSIPSMSRLNSRRMLSDCLDAGAVTGL